MSIEREILDANESFYQAFNRGDLNLMKSVWAQNDSVACIHPGWEVLRGFDVIIQSWEKIFVGLRIWFFHNWVHKAMQPCFIKNNGLRRIDEETLKTAGQWQSVENGQTGDRSRNE